MHSLKVKIWVGFVLASTIVALLSMLSYTEWPLSPANNKFVVIFGLIMGTLSCSPILFGNKIEGDISKAKFIISGVLLICSFVFEYLFISLGFLA